MVSAFITRRLKTQEPPTLDRHRAESDFPEAGTAALPAAEGSGKNLKRPVHELKREVEGVYRLRNRVAHLEPLINSRTDAQLANMRTVIGAIDQDMLGE